MLPRVDTFKKVLFTQRMVVYHESFVPLGKKSKVNPFACIWHEGISGRNKEDITSTFHALFIRYRDIEKIVLWLDNCSSQNKNWCFLSYLVFIINSDEISTTEIEINFFEPGHTFMSADHFHHQVEQSLKKQKKTYDFSDFSQAVKNANKGKVDVKEMCHRDFYLWKDNKSQQKLQKSTNKVLLREIVALKAIRGSFFLMYKKKFGEEYEKLDFLNLKSQKKIEKPSTLVKPCGFSQVKRDSILSNLKQVIPENRKMFWENLDVL